MKYALLVNVCYMILLTVKIWYFQPKIFENRAGGCNLPLLYRLFYQSSPFCGRDGVLSHRSFVGWIESAAFLHSAALLM